MPTDSAVTVVCGVGNGSNYEEVEKVLMKLRKNGRVTRWRPQFDKGAFVVTMARL